MKKIIMIAIFAASIMSCGNEKNITDNVVDKDPTEDNMVSGTVKDMSSKDGCGFVIEIKIAGNITQLEPLSLDSKFKVDGQKVQFIYTTSRRPSKCMGTMPITIEKIK